MNNNNKIKNNNYFLVCIVSFNGRQNTAMIYFQLNHKNTPSANILAIHK